MNVKWVSRILRDEFYPGGLSGLKFSARFWMIKT
jgi:hypothetical protein